MHISHKKKCTKNSPNNNHVIKLIFYNLSNKFWRDNSRYHKIQKDLLIYLFIYNFKTLSQ